jgi:hypothetical protein
LVSDPNKAEVIVYLPVSAPWQKTECADPKFRNKTVVLDEGDGPQLFDVAGEEDSKMKWITYFKRSYVHRHDGAFKGYMGYVEHPNVLPMTYTIAEAYVKSAFTTMSQRTFDLVCTLRGSNWDPTRLRYVIIIIGVKHSFNLMLTSAFC